MTFEKFRYAVGQTYDKVKVSRDRFL